MENYRENKALNQSMLKNYLVCPAYGKFLEENQQETDAMNFGSAFHDYMESKTTGKSFKYVVFNPADRPEPQKTMASNANKAWKEAFFANNEFALSEKDFEAIKAMYSNICTWVEFHLRKKDAEFERELYGVLSGFDCKGKADILQKKSNTIYIGDYKTCQSADINDIPRAIAEYKLHFQAAFYIDLAKQEFGEGLNYEFFWIFAEKTAPFLSNVVYASTQMIEIGRDEYQKAIEIYKQSNESKEFAGYEIFNPIEKGRRVPNYVDLPAYYVNTLEKKFQYFK